MRSLKVILIFCAATGILSCKNQSSQVSDGNAATSQPIHFYWTGLNGNQILLGGNSQREIRIKELTLELDKISKQDSLSNVDRVTGFMKITKFAVRTADMDHDCHIKAPVEINSDVALDCAFSQSPNTKTDTSTSTGLTVEQSNLMYIQLQSECYNLNLECQSDGCIKNDEETIYPVADYFDKRTSKIPDSYFGHCRKKQVQNQDLIPQQ